MGKISLGILDGVSGKVGNIVGSNWKGIDYIRAKADHRNDPKTEKQMNQRTKFKGVTAFARSLLSVIIRPIWNPKAGKMTGTNLFVKKNIGAFGVDGAIEDFSKLQLSVGDLPLPANISVVTDDVVDSGIKIKWENLLMQGSVDDKLMLVAVNSADESVATMLDLPFKRGDGAADVVLPFEARSDVNVYVFFGDVRGRSFSTSVYATVTL
jgi:hypothetical protein